MNEPDTIPSVLTPVELPAQQAQPAAGVPWLGKLALAALAAVWLMR